MCIMMQNGMVMQIFCFEKRDMRLAWFCVTDQVCLDMSDLL